MAIHRPIITSMVVSIDSARRGRSRQRSQSAPATAPVRMASGMARKNGAWMAARAAKVA
jgi:hypothetical protein